MVAVFKPLGLVNTLYQFFFVPLEGHLLNIYQHTTKYMMKIKEDAVIKYTTGKEATLGSGQGKSHIVLNRTFFKISNLHST